MILKFFYILQALFALKIEKQLLKRDFGTFLDHENKNASFLDHENKNASFLEPKFNENCDEISLEAASECEGEFEIPLLFVDKEIPVSERVAESLKDPL